MTAAPARNRLVTLSATDLAERLPEALGIYLEAMGYPHGTARQRGPLWLEHRRRPGWRAVACVDSREALIGVGYGYGGAPGQWWYDEVRRGLRDAGGSELEDAGKPWLRDYFELTELHVRPGAQGVGLGEAMLRDLLARTDHARVLLSTPEEVPERPSRAWRLYRRMGFRDVLRRYRFSGDARLFAVLGRTLPLSPVTASDTDHPPG